MMYLDKSLSKITVDLLKNQSHKPSIGNHAPLTPLAVLRLTSRILWPKDNA